MHTRTKNLNFMFFFSRNLVKYSVGASHGCVSYTPLLLDRACSCQHNVNRGDCLVSAD